MVFENRKNKITFGPKIVNWTYQKCLFWFRVFSIQVYNFLERHSREFKYPRRHFALGSTSFSVKINDFWWFFDGFWLGFGRYWDRVVDILVFHFRKSASRGFEPTRDFGVLVTGFRQWWLPLRQRRGCGLRGAVRGELETDVGAPIPSILFSVSAFYAEPRLLVPYELPTAV